MAKYATTSTGDRVIMAEIWVKDARELMRIISEKINPRKTEGVVLCENSYFCERGQQQ